MPIPCVDLIVEDHAGRILLLHRKNEPAANQWWFPGGRVLFGETRPEAARRKLKEECGLTTERELTELGTLDWFFGFDTEQKAHSITTLFDVLVDSASAVVLDDQSYEARWKSPQEWLRDDLDTLVKTEISLLLDRRGTIAGKSA